MIKSRKAISLKLLTVFLFSIFAAGNLFAAPHNGDEFKLNQPDGTTIDVKIWGDEYYQRVESLDGYTLIKDPDTKWICYAVLSSDGNEFESTGIKYSESSIYNYSILSSFLPSITKGIKLPSNIVEKKANEVKEILNENSSSVYGLDDISSDPTGSLGNTLTGNQKGLTLLVDFSDDEATISQSEIENYLNQTGYNNYNCNGSIKDYYSDVSGGLLIYTNHVTAYYRAKNPKTYYTDESISYGTRARELILEALNWLEDEVGFDFSTLSTNSSGYIRAINTFYAGNTQNAWAKGLWPHMSAIYGSFSADGVKSGKYQITNIGTTLNLRTFAHENGHMLFGWADLYDYNYDSAGIGNYCLMGYGASNKNPIPPNPAFRYSAGWENIVDITDSEQNTTISIESNSLTTYRYANSNDIHEYFIIDSRIKSGRNTYCPDEGLAIWHVDEYGSNNYPDMTEDKHYKVSIEQADGLFQLENYQSYGSDGDFFHKDYADKFDNSTTPNSKWWDGGESGLSISDISEVGSSMTFVLNGSDTTFQKTYDQVYFRGTPNGWETTTMELVADYTWQTEVTFGDGDSNGGPRFKFDVYGDWSLNFGDNNSDGYADQSGEDISAVSGKTYIITFNDNTKQYTMKSNGYVSNYENLYIRGTNNSWETSQMELVNDYTWEIKNVQFNNGDSSGGPRFKFDVYGDWSLNFGDNNSDGYADQSGNDISINNGSGLYTIRFNDQDKSYSITKEGTDYLKTFDQVYYRGDSNDWGTSEMSLVGDYKWQINVTIPDSPDTFKFDIYGDWSLNFGDNNSDGYADQEGSNISFNSGTGEYTIIFYDDSKYYTVTKN